MSDLIFKWTRKKRRTNWKTGFCNRDGTSWFHNIFWWILYSLAFCFVWFCTLEIWTVSRLLLLPKRISLSIVYFYIVDYSDTSWSSQYLYHEINCLNFSNTIVSKILRHNRILFCHGNNRVFHFVDGINCVGGTIYIHNHNLSTQHVAFGFYPKYHMNSVQNGREGNVCVDENENGACMALTMFISISPFLC